MIGRACLLSLSLLLFLGLPAMAQTSTQLGPAARCIVAQEAWLAAKPFIVQELKFREEQSGEPLTPPETAKLINVLMEHFAEELDAHHYKLIGSPEQCPKGMAIRHDFPHPGSD